MGESRASKETRKRLEDRDRQAEEDRKRLQAKVEQPSAIEQRREAALLRDLDYFDNPTPDYSVAPRGLIDSTAFQRAALNRLHDRTATGASQMGSHGANPTLLALNREANDTRIAEEGAGAYASNLAGRREEAIGGSNAMTQLALQRLLSLSGQATSHAGQAGQNLASFQPQPSAWGRIGLAAVQGAAGIGASALTGGASRVGGALLSSARPQSAADYSKFFNGFKHGGRVDKAIGMKSIVGEDGREIFVADDGETQVLGARGAEVGTFTKPGVVVPNHVIRGISIPSPRAETVTSNGSPNSPRISVPSPDPSRWHADAPAPSVPLPPVRRESAPAAPALETIEPPSNVYNGIAIPSPSRGRDLLNTTIGTIAEGLERAPINPLAARPQLQRTGDPLTDLRAHEQDLTDYANTAKDRNGKWRSGAAMALRAIADWDGRGGAPALVGRAIGQGVGGIVVPRVDERLGARDELGRVRNDINTEYGRRKVQGDYDEQQSTIALRREQAELARQKPEMERWKREGMVLDKERSRLLSVWRTLGEYDPAQQPRIAQEAERLGVELPTYKRGEKPPPRFNHLGQVFEYVKDDASGDYYARNVQDSTGSALPVDSSKVPNSEGLLPSTVANLGMRRLSLQLSTERFRASLEKDLSTGAKRQFDVESHGLFQEREAIKKRIDALKTREAMKQIAPADAAQRLQALEAEAGDIDADIEGARSRALSAMGGRSTISVPSPRRPPKVNDDLTPSGARPQMPAANLSRAAEKLVANGRFKTLLEAENYIKQSVELIP